MTTVFWISGSIITIALILYVAGAIFNIRLLQSIPEAFIIPSAGVIVLCLLNDYLPDATHIVKVTVIGLTSVTMASFFAIIEKSRFAKFLTYIFFTGSIISWIELYGSTFNIYPVFRSSKIIATAVYIAIFIIILIHIRKQRKLYMFFSFICYLPAAFLNFCAIITLQKSRRSYAYALTTGTCLLILFIMYQIFRDSKVIKFNERIQRIVFTILLVSSEILITTSGLLMIK